MQATLSTDEWLSLHCGDSRHMLRPKDIDCQGMISCVVRCVLKHVDAVTVFQDGQVLGSHHRAGPHIASRQPPLHGSSLVNAKKLALIGRASLRERRQCWTQTRLLPCRCRSCRRTPNRSSRTHDRQEPCDVAARGLRTRVNPAKRSSHASLMRGSRGCCDRAFGNTARLAVTNRRLPCHLLGCSHPPRKHYALT